MHRPRSDSISTKNEFDQIFAKAIDCQNRGGFDKAVRLYKKLLKIKPDLPLVCNNLACVLLEQKKFDEASEWFARSLTLMPQLLKQYGNVLVTLNNVLPFIGAAAERAFFEWPKRLPPDELLKPRGLRDIANNPLLLHLLRSSPIREIGFERLLVSIRQQYSAMFAKAGWPPTDLDRWHAFETQYPDTFTGMYQFWVQKP